MLALMTSFFLKLLIGSIQARKECRCRPRNIGRGEGPRCTSSDVVVVEMVVSSSLTAGRALVSICQLQRRRRGTGQQQHYSRCWVSSCGDDDAIKNGEELNGRLFGVMHRTLVRR